MSEPTLAILLQGEGFIVSEGEQSTRKLIYAVSDDGENCLCSGFKVFPDGKKCGGCPDCLEPRP